MRDFQLQVLQDGPFAGQQQLVVANAGQLAAEADRHASLQAELPFLELAAGQHAEGGRAGLIEVVLPFWLIKLVAQAEPAIAADGIETRQQEVAGGDQFQLATLDFPLLLADFHAARQRFAVDAGPIECHAGGRRLVGRANQPAVGHRQTHDVPQAIFGAEHIGERLFDLGAEQEVLRAGLGFAVGAAAAASRCGYRAAVFFQVSSALSRPILRASRSR